MIFWSVIESSQFVGVGCLPPDRSLCSLSSTLFLHPDDDAQCVQQLSRSHTVSRQQHHSIWVYSINWLMSNNHHRHIYRTGGSNGDTATNRHIPFTLPPSRRCLQLTDRSGSDVRIQQLASNHQRSSSSTANNRQQLPTITNSTTDIAYHCEYLLGVTEIYANFSCEQFIGMSQSRSIR